MAYLPARCSRRGIRGISQGAIERFTKPFSMRCRNTSNRTYFWLGGAMYHSSGNRRLQSEICRHVICTLSNDVLYVIYFGFRLQRSGIYRIYAAMDQETFS